MVALSPSFTFLATLCTLTAISMAPISEAAVLQLRAPHQEVTSTFDHTRPRAATSHDHYASSMDSSRAGLQEEDKIYAPLLSIPKPTDVPPKNKTDSTDGSGSLSSKSDRKSPSGGDLHGEEDDSEGDEDKHASHGDEGSVSKKEKAKDISRRWYLQRPMEQLKGLLGDKILGDNHVHYVRAPDHHHHHHHHHHHGRRRSRMNWGREYKHVSGDNEHIIYSRAPHHHHDSHEKVIVSGNHDHVRVERSPHHDHDRHHHHDGHEKVIVSGDNDHVHVHRSVFIAGEQGQSYIVPHVTKRAIAQESFSLPSLGKRNGDIDGAPGRIDIVSPVAGSADGKRIASLVLASSNSTSATSDSPTTYSSEFVLNASETESTQMYLLPVSDSSTTQFTSMLASDEKGVTIRLAMFDRASASVSPFCATFDPNPPVPGPLTAEECAVDPVGEHRSQLFAFNQVTGVVRPMWFDGQSDGTEPEEGDCSGNAPPTPLDASLVGATEASANNVTSSPSTTPTTIGNSTVLSADIPQATPSNSSGSGISGVQKVALVFVAADPEILDIPADLANTTTSSVLATSTGVGASDNAISTANGPSTTMASSSPGSLAATSPIVLASASGSSSVSASTPPSTASNAAISASVSTGMSGSIPSSAAAASGLDSTPTTVLGVQVVPTTEGIAPSTSTTSMTPVMTPVSTQPYEWMFKPNSRS
ncbi:hypothetical protein EDB92DRAFT_1831240 [Lactarius akahatsu]|uniref:Uncharacterized protein n=1 Tax=Lactarius akahatsu TaxID=416441 RepID=A0AAD4LQV0_9AGAM|nr:hypothetical protein EDB92DRAFT_1831240 [Lactarius akahatsu]